VEVYTKLLTDPFGILNSVSVIVLAIRTRKPVFKSRPGRYLLMATLAIVGITVIFPFTPPARLFGFHPLPFWFYPVISM